MMEYITRLSNSSDQLRYPERGKCRLINYRCDGQPIVSLESCDSFPGHRPKSAIDRPLIITVALQLLLNINNYLIGCQSVVAVDWTVIWIIGVRGITPCREPVARVPKIPAGVHKNDSVVVASPPTTIVPLSVVIAEDRILLTAERRTVEVVINSRVAIHVGVPRPIDRDISITIERYIVARTKLLRVSITINLNVFHAVRREVSLAINRHIISPAKGLIPREISFPRHAHPVLINDCVWTGARRADVRPLPIRRGRTVIVRAHRTRVRWRCRSNIRCSLRPPSHRPFIFDWLTPRCERQCKSSNAH